MDKIIKNEQLELFPDTMWEEYEYNGKTYKRYVGDGKTPYRKQIEMKMNLERFIDEHKKTI